MRILFCLVLTVCAAAHAESQTISPKARAEMDKLDAKISVLNHDIRQNAIKATEFKNKVETLREKINEAKDPDNRARLEKALATMDEQKKFYDALISSQRTTIADLLTERRFMSNAYQGETIKERNTTLGVEGDAAKRAAAEERKREDERTGRTQTAGGISTDDSENNGDSEPNPRRAVRLNRK